MMSAGVIGWPIAHSKSPLIHRFWLAKLGLNGDYGRFAVAPERLGDAIRALPALGLRGVNVTVPHKVAALAYIDRADGWVQDTGALNCLLVERSGDISGCNTDVLALIDIFQPFAHADLPTVLIGAGGAARAALVGLMQHGQGPLTLMNRSRLNAEHVLAATSAGGMIVQLDAPLPDDAKLIINASLLGMSGQPPLVIDLARVPDDAIVFDMVYAPLETPLLAAARARGLRTIDGLSMLIGQAAAAFELFFGTPAPREHDAELRVLLVRTSP